MLIHLRICGLLLLLLAGMHAGFPRKFRWREECFSMSLLNRQMMYIHTLFIAVILLLMGLLCVAEAEDLLTTRLGAVFCRGIMAFWMLRLCVQLFGYSPALWRGRRFETGAHVAFTGLWTYLSAVFGIAGWA